MFAQLPSPWKEELMFQGTDVGHFPGQCPLALLPWLPDPFQVSGAWELSCLARETFNRRAETCHVNPADRNF